MKKGRYSMALTLMDPAVILFRGDIFSTLCVEADGTGQNIALSLRTVDPTGNTHAQLWQYGSDQRIYQYDGTASPAFCIGLNGAVQEENALILVTPSTTDTTQQWSLQTTVPSITNVPNAGYCMNDASGLGRVGDQVIIFPNTETDNVVWSFAIYPQFPNQPTS
jgi:hypothetical protein